MQKETKKINIGRTVLRTERIVIIAGPCSVESKEQILSVAKEVKCSGASVLRGGAFKPRTSPYAFQGLGDEGVSYLEYARDISRLPVITEITHPRHIEEYQGRVDCFQVGAKNMQNFELLKELGKVSNPVMIKRGYAATYRELLLAAEYVIKEGNDNIILCERGIRTAERETRNTLDISAIPVLRTLTDLPIVIDPSHAGGRADIVPALSKAAVAAGADGVMIEVHNEPDEALCDGEQSLTPDAFHRLVIDLKKIASAIGRSI